MSQQDKPTQEPKEPKKTSSKEVPIEEQAWYKAWKSMDSSTEQLYRDLAQQQAKHMRRLIQKRQKYAQRLQKSYAPMNPNSDEDIAIDGDIVQGSRVYTQNCLSCHTLAPSTAALNTSGPALGLIYQRRAASDINFNGYSKPLLDADIYWSGRNLFKYLESPSTFIKGSKCMFVTGGLKSEEDRVDVIKFLKQYSKEMAKNMRIKSEDLHGKDYVKMQLVAQRQMNKQLPKD